MNSDWKDTSAPATRRAQGGRGPGGFRARGETQGGGSGTCRVDDAGGARYSRGRRGFRICCAGDAAGRTLRAADGIGRTRGGLTPSRAQKSFPPLEMIWITYGSFD